MVTKEDFNSEQRIILETEADFRNDEEDPVKDVAIVNSSIFTVRKLLRSKTGYLNARDKVAAEALIKDMKKHCI